MGPTDVTGAERGWAWGTLSEFANDGAKSPAKPLQGVTFGLD